MFRSIKFSNILRNGVPSMPLEEEKILRVVRKEANSVTEMVYEIESPKWLLE